MPAPARPARTRDWCSFGPCPAASASRRSFPSILRHSGPSGLTIAMDAELDRALDARGGVARRERAGGIGGGGVAREQVGAAPAATEVELAAVAGPAGLRHPRVAAEACERR